MQGNKRIYAENDGAGERQKADVTLRGLLKVAGLIGALSWAYVAGCCKEGWQGNEWIAAEGYAACRAGANAPSTASNDWHLPSVWRRLTTTFRDLSVKCVREACA